MKILASLKLISVLLIISLVLTGSIGCGTEFENLALELLEEWSDAHDVNPSTVGGAANLAKRAASGSTGNEEADAAIGLVKTVQSIQAGDKLMEEGKELRTKGKLEESAKKKDEADDKRPDDWTYRVSRSALSFEQGDSSQAINDFRAGQASAGHQPEVYWDEEGDVRSKIKHVNPGEEVRFYTQYIDEIESSKLDPSKMDRQTKYDYYSTLGSAYFWRYMTGTETDAYTNEQRDYDRDMWKHYSGLAEQSR